MPRIIRRICGTTAWCFALLPLVCVLSAAELQGASQTAARKDEAAKAPATAGEQKFKAIWEPVNVKEDLQLTSVHFVSAEEGWAAGGKNALNGGVILHTKDGGATWETQLGDPQSSDRAYGQMRFLNATTGWAVQGTSGGDHKLMRTTDGQSWVPVGTVGQSRTDYQFVSQDVGFWTGHDQIMRTQDGGRSWQPVYRCRVKAEVQGLTREMACEFSKLFFLNERIGFAISMEMDRGTGFAFAKTTDGGMTWNPSVILPGENGKEGALYFLDENNGILRTIDGKLFRTSDGGKSWSGVSGQPEGKPEIEFVEGSLGWMVRYRTMTYSRDGGKSWVSRKIGFPASVEAFSLVRRDRGYAVGEHGMAYRYRVVPIDYTAKGMIEAPMMPGK
jgi:photosystem II stability/assembly factor-like uncharacterized protein